MTHINHSQIKTWRACEQKWDYRYGQHLIPRRRDRPMYIGSWLHAALETHYRNGDWRKGHQLYLDEYNRMFDEEKEALDNKEGSLPERIERIMEAYLWWWQNDGWSAMEVEYEWRGEYRTANGVSIPLGGRADLIVADPEGSFWVVDHKTTATIPPETAFHAMDPQLILYPWGISKQVQSEPIAGVIYNYIRSKPPSVPVLNKDGSLSKRAIVTDYRTALKFLLENGRNPRDYSEYLDSLADHSELFVRYKLPTNKDATTRILKEAAATALRIQSHKMTTRNVTRECARCPYQQVCRAELFGLDTQFMRSRDFTIEEDADGDPGFSEPAD